MKNRGVNTWACHRASPMFDIIDEPSSSKNSNRTPVCGKNVLKIILVFLIINIILFSKYFNLFLSIYRNLVFFTFLLIKFCLIGKKTWKRRTRFYKLFSYEKKLSIESQYFYRRI